MCLMELLYFALELRGTTVAITEVIENQQDPQKEIEELDDSPSSSPGLGTLPQGTSPNLNVIAVT
jgi:hypothetical protein